MKRFYLMMNIFMGVATLLLLFGHWYFQAAPPDKALKRTPLPLPDEPVKVTAGLSLPIPVTAELRDKNLFDPGRGKVVAPEEKNTAAQPGRPQLELIGICHLGKSSGAIITEKNQRRPAGPATGGKEQKRYFKAGEEVRNGYILETIDLERVVLKRGHEIIELKIGRERFAAQNVAAGKNPGNMTPLTIASQQQASPPGGPGPTVNPRAGVKDLNRPPPPQNMARK